MQKKLDLNDLRLLLKVVEHKSFTAAAGSTGIPVSTISQRITGLESFVGTALLRRTTRSLSLTDAGRALLPHAKVIDNAAKQAEYALLDRQKELNGTLRISTSFALSQFALAPLLPGFLRQHPKVSIRISVTNRYVDLIGEGYDLCLRAHDPPLKDSSLRQRIVAHTPWSLAAAPSWLAAHGPPERPEDLARFDTLYFALTNESPSWLLRKNGMEVKSDLIPRVWSDEMATLKRAAIEGGGITSLPEYILRSALETGELVPVLPGWLNLVSKISIISPPRTQTSRLAATFSDYLMREIHSATDDRRVSARPIDEDARAEPTQGV